MMNLAPISALIILVYLSASPAIAGNPDENDRAMALLATLGVLAHGEKAGDRVGWKGAGGFGGAAVLISVGSNTAILETQRKHDTGKIERESFSVASYAGRRWKVNFMWLFMLLSGPLHKPNDGCFELSGELMLRYEHLFVEGTICHSKGVSTVVKATIRAA